MAYFNNSNLEVFKADENTFDTEWLDFALSVKLVKDCDEAIEHINKHSSLHSETIISNDASNIAKFQRLINSSCIYANASTLLAMEENLALVEKLEFQPANCMQEVLWELKIFALINI